MSLPLYSIATLLLSHNAFGFVMPASQTLAPFRRASPASHAFAKAPSLTMMATAQEEAATKRDALDQARKLESMAAELRAQASALENEKNAMKEQTVRNQFERLDKDGNGVIDVQELVAGLEPVLREKLKRRMKKRMGTSPTPAQVDNEIQMMPGATLIDPEAADQLLAQFDANEDGVLQLNEFAGLEVFRQRLERIVSDKETMEREAARALREEEQAQAMMQEIYDALEVNNGIATPVDRALSTLPYMLPLLDAAAFGGHLLQSNDLTFLQPLLVAGALYRAIPFSGIASFFGLQFLAGNPRTNKLIRYNLRQAVNLDILIAVPSVLISIALGLSGRNGEAFSQLLNSGSDAIFLTALAAIAYSVASSALGQFPNKLPLLKSMNPEDPDRDDGPLM